jgi:hypothetical protein
MEKQNVATDPVSFWSCLVVPSTTQLADSGQRQDSGAGAGPSPWIWIVSSCFLVLMGSWHLQLKHLPCALKQQPLAPFPPHPHPTTLPFYAAFGVESPYRPCMAHRAPHLRRTKPLAFSFLKIHSQFLLWCCSEAFGLQFEWAEMTACCLLGGDCGCGVSWEHAHLATICPCRCHVSLLGSGTWVEMLSVLENGQELPAAISVGGHRRIKGGKGCRRLHGFSHCDMNGHCPRR